MTKYEIGDRCVITNLEISGGMDSNIGKEVCIIETMVDDCEDKYIGKFVDPDRASIGEYTLRDSELKLINKKQTYMEKLNIFASKILNGQTKKFIKAGYICSKTLRPTEAGLEVLYSVMWDANLAALETAADAEIAEQEAEAKR